jgi:hypothetical protein
LPHAPQGHPYTHPPQAPQHHPMSQPPTHYYAHEQQMNRRRMTLHPERGRPQYQQPLSPQYSGARQNPSVAFERYFSAAASEDAHD